MVTFLHVFLAVIGSGGWSQGQGSTDLQVIRSLRAGITSSDPLTRSKAVMHAAWFVNGSDDSVRRLALYPGVLEGLVKTLSDSEEQYTALWFIGSLGPKAKAAIPAVIECFNATYLPPAFQTLVSITGGMDQAIVEADRWLDQGNFGQRRGAAIALSNLYKGVEGKAFPNNATLAQPFGKQIRFLLPHLNEADPETQQVVTDDLLYLANFVPRTFWEPVFPTLMRGMKSPATAWHRSAVRIGAVNETPIMRAVDILPDLATGYDEVSRRYGMIALQRCSNMSPLWVARHLSAGISATKAADKEAAYARLEKLLPALSTYGGAASLQTQPIDSRLFWTLRHDPAASRADRHAAELYLLQLAATGTADSDAAVRTSSARIILQMDAGLNVLLSTGIRTGMLQEYEKDVTPFEEATDLAVKRVQVGEPALARDLSVMGAKLRGPHFSFL